jgi:GNAT superfamily N-acetyltransferase
MHQIYLSKLNQDIQILPITDKKEYEEQVVAIFNEEPHFQGSPAKNTNTIAGIDNFTYSPIFVAIHKDKVVGWVRIHLDFFTSWAYLSYATTKKAQGKGVATTLIHHALRYAKGNKINFVYAETYENIQSSTILEKFNFIKLGTLPEQVAIYNYDPSILTLARKLDKTIFFYTL